MTNTTTIRIRVIPNARNDEIAGWHGDLLKVKCRAPAIEGRANEAVIALLAARIGVRRGALRFVRGERAREKVISVDGLSAEEVRSMLPDRE